MSQLVQLRCHTHGDREAAARCPQCERFYCRECITEHEGKVICASCLAIQSQAAAPAAPKKRDSSLRRIASITLALLVGYVVFYLLGWFLAHIPTDVHDGTWNP